MKKQLEKLEAQFAVMRRWRLGGLTKPHKLLMLLAVLDLFDANEAGENRIKFDPGLVERFGAYFQVAVSPGDWCPLLTSDPNQVG